MEVKQKDVLTEKRQLNHFSVLSLFHAFSHFLFLLKCSRVG